MDRKPPPEQWSADEVAAWLAGTSITAVDPARFVADGISGALFMTLDDGDLKDLGIEKGLSRKRLLFAIAKLGKPAPAPAQREVSARAGVSRWGGAGGAGGR